MPSRGGEPGETARILHLDTDTRSTDRLVDAFDRAVGSYEVVSVSDPTDALVQIERGEFDCIVSGYDLPGMDGLEVLSAVRRKRDELPFILFPESGDEAVASRAISAGVTDYIRRDSAREGVDAVAERVRAVVDTPEDTSQYDRQQFERFLQAFPDVVFVMDEEGRYLDVLSGDEQSLLYEDAETLLGERYHDVLPAETAERFLATVQQALDTGEQQQIEYQLDVQRGQRWFEARVGPLETRGAQRTVYWIARDITERKRREREYEQIFNGVPNPMTVNDPETGEILEVNDALCETLGYDKETILEKGNAGLAVDEEGYTGNRAREIVERVMASGEPETFEWKLEAADGSHRILEVTGRPAEINGEQRYVSITRDITERKRRQREYEQIFNKVTDAIAVFDPDTGDILDVNDTYREMFGYDDVETIQELGIDGLSATEAGYTGERGKRLINEVSRTGEATTVEWQAKTRDSERIWVEATLTPAEIGGEQRVLSIQRDITERRELEQTYRDIFENVSDGLVVHDPATGRILEVNERYCELTGYDREELLDGTIQLILPEDPEYTYEDALERITRARNEGPQLFEFKGQRKDGGIFVGEIHLRTVEIRGNERVLASVRDITERKRREQEYEQIFNNVNDIIAVRDPDTGELLDVNQSYADLLGYDRDEMRGKDIGDVGVPAEGYDHEQGMEHIREVLAADGPVEFEWKLEDAEGRTHLMDVRGTAALINGEQRYLAIGRDVTERKRRERAIETLQQAMERLQTATTTDEVAAIAVDAASDVLDIPMAICWLAGTDDERLRPVATTAAVREADDRAREGDDAVREVGDSARETDPVPELVPGSYEYEAFSDGEVTQYASQADGVDARFETGVVLPLSDHGLVAVGTQRDVSVGETVLDIATALADHVTTALDRVEREQAVRESERRFRLIAERIDEVIYLAELDFSELLYVNPAYEDIWGRPIEALYGDSTAFIGGIDERDRERFVSDFEAMLAEIEAGDPDDTYEFEFRVRQPNGEVRWVNATGYVVELSGEKHRYVGIVDDITERKRREQRLEVFNRILRHNLRNQLDVIRSHAEELAEAETSQAEAEADSGHARRIISAVDDLAAIGAEARQTDRIMSTEDERVEVALGEIIDGVVEATEPTRRAVDVTTEVPTGSTLLTNEQAVHVAVESALENAIEHAESTVTVAVEENSRGYVVTIDDDGPGIPEEELVPIETGTETNLRHGRGLGLWQLRWSVDKLNGELSFETTDGTTVRITVPDQRETP